MLQFDFKSYHMRAINAADESEKAKINQELKQVYESLSEEDKKDFNLQLEKFLIKEYSAIRSVVDGVKAGENPN